MLLAALNFTNLNAEGYASFVLALIFTIVTLASAIYVVRHKTLSTAVVVVLALVLPMVTIFCWAYLILTIFEQGLVNTLCISFACAIGYGIIALCIALLAKPRTKVEQTETVEETTEEENIESEEISQVKEEEEETEEAQIFTPVLNAEEEVVETEEPKTEEVETDAKNEDEE